MDYDELQEIIDDLGHIQITIAKERKNIDCADCEEFRCIVERALSSDIPRGLRMWCIALRGEIDRVEDE